MKRYLFCLRKSMIMNFQNIKIWIVFTAVSFTLVIQSVVQLPRHQNRGIWCYLSMKSCMILILRWIFIDIKVLKICTWCEISVFFMYYKLCLILRPSFQIKDPFLSFSILILGYAFIVAYLNHWSCENVWFFLFWTYLIVNCFLHWSDDVSTLETEGGLFSIHWL